MLIENNKYTQEHIYRFLLNYKYPSTGRYIGDISFVIRGYNQEKQLKQTLTSIAPFASEIIYIDDCSTDNSIDIAKDFGAKICQLPDGWIYTYGFAQLIKLSVALCSSTFFFQIDTDERLYVPEDGPELNPSVIKHNIRLMDIDHKGNYTTVERPEKVLTTRNFDQIQMTSVIHQQGQAHSIPIEDTNILTVHVQKFLKQSPDFLTRKNLLFDKLLIKGALTNNLSSFSQKWVRVCNRNIICQNVLDNEKARGKELVETTAGILLNGWPQDKVNEVNTLVDNEIHPIYMPDGWANKFTGLQFNGTE